MRLALMGVLTESYQASAKMKSSSGQKLRTKSDDLPGGLSFAIRELSNDELDRCLDPDSLSALDFLRLQYKPPAPIDAIITPVCLHKYDLLFKFLLRIVRMLFVVNQLFQDVTNRTSLWKDIEPVAQNFRIQAHHFVSVVSEYFFDTGIGIAWTKFEKKLDQIEALLDAAEHSGDYGVLGQSEGLSRLHEYHQRVLDRMMFALLLRKRQEPILKLLEEIFSTILLFARHSRTRSLGMQKDVATNQDIGALYAKFRKRIAVFVGVCRGLSEKRGYGDKKSLESWASEEDELFGHADLSEEGGNMISRLLLKLEMTGYYSHPI
jgi:hypothetical protein